MHTANREKAASPKEKEEQEEKKTRKEDKGKGLPSIAHCQDLPSTTARHMLTHIADTRSKQASHLASYRRRSRRPVLAHGTVPIPIRIRF